MKTLFSALLLAASATAAAISPKFDAGSRVALAIDSTAASRAQKQLAAIVSIDGNCDILSDCGLEVQPISPGMAVARGTLEALEAAAGHEAVRRIHIGRRVGLCNDLSAADTHADVVRSAPGIDRRAYTGRGVLAGLFDTGFDFANPSFSRDGRPRIESVAIYSDEGECTAYTRAADIDTLTTDLIGESHGSHVLGTMAGFCEGSPYSGMAPDADIAVGCGALLDANIVSGVADIAALARATGRPCVINLSISDFCGPHDGTDDFARGLAEAAGDDAILVLSAGNYHGRTNSISRTLSADDAAIRTFIYPGNDGFAGIWSGDSRPMTLTPVIVDRQTGAELARYSCISEPGEPMLIGTPDLADKIPDLTVDPTFTEYFKESYFAIEYSLNSDTNSRPNFYIAYRIERRSDTNGKGRYGLGIIVEGSPGQRIDLNTESSEGSFYSAGLQGWTAGSDEFSISSMACAQGVICVGAHTTRNSWVTAAGNPDGIAADHPLGQITPWSSRGTLIDGRTLPHVSAPGAAIVSVLSSYDFDKRPDHPDIIATSETDGRTNYWGLKWGTSMSAPAVAGAIATWLEADPALTAHDVLDIIAATARREPAMEADPVAWGAGKFDAEAGIREVLRRKASLAGPSAVDAGALTIERHSNTLTVNRPCTLHNLAGTLMARSDNGRIKLDGLPSGFYIVRSDNGAKVVAI
ncbi:MAG: S8 family serine peptidase [Muribaculaceae bacterium]|nr:S8 family serine peptidase [Muribaculaceae bacterium]